LITLDGSHGEGGGQILRTALTLSLLTGRPFRIVRIRANRPKPGLRPQHLAAVSAAAELGDAVVIGAGVGSRELTFRPSAYTPRDLTINIGTAGSTALVLHTLHLPLAVRAKRPVRLTLNGGTFNLAAPSFPFLESTWRSYMAAMGMPVALSMPRAGFFPVGGGQLEAWIEPASPRRIIMHERGPLRRVYGTSGVANLPGRNIAERMRSQAEQSLGARGLIPEITLNDWSSRGQGAAISLTAEHEHIATTFVGLGERGKPSEAVANEAATELLAYEESAGAVDVHSADQILVPLALASGRSEFTCSAVSDHLRTNAQTIQAFLDREIRIDEPANAPPRVIVV
jgi:RNA 3'-terminal phosphate cyclase (ATP)